MKLLCSTLRNERNPHLVSIMKSIFVWSWSRLVLKSMYLIEADEVVQNLIRGKKGGGI